MLRIDAAFETQQAVASAVDQLLQFGFPQSAIDYHADDRFRTPPDAVKRDSGILSTVSTFFAKVRGTDSEPLAAAYGAIIQRGGMILSVETNSPVEAQTAKILFRNAGAIDTDARRGSPPYGAESPPPAAEPGKGTGTELRAFQPGIVEMRHTVERVSVGKHTRVVEELTVDKSVVVYSEEITDTLRATVVDIAHRPAGELPTP